MEEQIFTTFGTCDRQNFNSNGEESPFIAKTEQQNHKGENAHNNVSVGAGVETVAGFSTQQKTQLKMAFLDTPVGISDPAAHPSVERLPNGNPIVSPVQGDVDDVEDEKEVVGRRSMREKKTTEVFKVEEPKEMKNLELMEGAGERLRDIPNVAFKLSKITGRDEAAESLHHIIYRRRGQIKNRKRHLLDFNGLAFPDESNESEIAARKAIMRKLKLDIIHRLLDMLNIPRGAGDKEAKIDLLIAFLLHPKKMSEVDLAEREAAKRQKLKRKREKDLKRVSQKKRNRKPKKIEKTAEVEKPVSEQVGEEPVEPVMKLNFDEIKQKLYGMLDGMTNDELGMMTTKIIISKLNDEYNLDMRPRKSEIKQMAQEYATKRLTL